MSDKKSEKKKDAGSGHGGGGGDIMRDLYIFIAIMIVVYISINITPVNFNTLLSGAVFKDLFLYATGRIPIPDSFEPILIGIKSVLTVFGIFLFGAVIWVKLRAGEVHHKEHAMFEPIHVEEEEAKEKSIQWQIVLNHLESENPAEWKLAILEADNMLDDILEHNGYQGESLGEKLKSINPAELKSYQEAWEAHKVRNQVAHEGSNMDFSRKIARDTIYKFEKVFKELGYI
jgi:hypothetical protein